MDLPEPSPLMSVHGPDDDHLWLVARRLLAGRVVAFLGAGANLLDRPQGGGFVQGRHLPSGSELARLLARETRFPDSESTDLLRVSQYVDAVLGERALYEYLRSLFNEDYPPNALHRFLARLAPILRSQGAPGPLILTTNYDDALERAFEAIGVAYDLVWYEAKHGPNCGRFVHRSGTEDVVIEQPNRYSALALEERPVILKLHGAINRRNPRGDSYVITEDNYIDYLSRNDISREIPMTLREQMTDSHFLFLGYSMRDWNLRVILRRLWGQQPLDLKSWAIQRAQPDRRLREIEEKLWSDRGDVDLVYAELDEYVTRLSRQVDELAGVAAEP